MEVNGISLKYEAGL